MSGFTETALEKKLADLNNSATSIQQLSLWLLHHRKHFQAIVRNWYKELCKTTKERKLTFMYLANDAVQNAKKKHPEYVKEFGVHMKKVFEHLVAMNFDEKTCGSIGRLIKIWRERQIFDEKRQIDVEKVWKDGTGEGANPKKRRTKSPGTPPDPPPKQPKKEAKGPKTPPKEPNSPIKTPPSTERNSKPLTERLSESQLDLEPEDGISSAIFDDDVTTLSPNEFENEAPSPLSNATDRAGKLFNMKIRDLVFSTLSPNKVGSPGDGGGDPPEPEELIKALQELENSASSDAHVREKIAKLPPEVSEVAHLARLESSQEGQKLLRQVEDATQLLDGYNERLQAELTDRKKVGKMVAEFLSAQNDLLAQAEERLEVYRDKLDKINSVKDELKSHIAALPDLSQLPNVTDGLAPLPSAGDLFTIR